MGPVFPLTDFLSSAPFRTPYPVRRFVHLLVVYRRPLHGKDPTLGSPRRGGVFPMRPLRVILVAGESRGPEPSSQQRR